MEGLLSTGPTPSSLCCDIAVYFDFFHTSVFKEPILHYRTTNIIPGCQTGEVAAAGKQWKQFACYGSNQIQTVLCSAGQSSGGAWILTPTFVEERRDPEWTTLYYNTLHYTTSHLTTQHYTTLYCTALHYFTLDITILHYNTLHYLTLHYTRLNFTSLDHTSLHHRWRPWHSCSVAQQPTAGSSHHTGCVILHPLHYTSPLYTTLHLTTLHYTTPHHTTLHYT